MDAKAWDERYAAADDYVWGVEPNRFVREMCETLPLGRAVDLACGEGRNALWLARLGWQTHGIDYSAVAIGRAQALTGQLSDQSQRRATWSVADVAAAGFAAQPADLVLLSYVHLPPDQHLALLRAAAAAVVPEGHVVVVGHDRRNLDDGVGGPQDRSLLYEPDVIAGVFTEHGLVIEAASTVPRPTPDGIALDTVVRARRPRQPDSR